MSPECPLSVPSEKLFRAAQEKGARFWKSWAYAEAETGNGGGKESAGFLHDETVLRRVSGPEVWTATTSSLKNLFTRRPVVSVYEAAKKAGPVKDLGRIVVCNVHLKSKNGDPNRNRKEVQAMAHSSVNAWLKEQLKVNGTYVKGCIVLAGDFNFSGDIAEWKPLTSEGASDHVGKYTLLLPDKQPTVFAFQGDPNQAGAHDNALVRFHDGGENVGHLDRHGVFSCKAAL
eukprot:359054-Chlamydomonas_euryale.AAC.7